MLEIIIETGILSIPFIILLSLFFYIYEIAYKEKDAQ